MPDHKRGVELIVCASCPYEVPEITSRLVQLLDGPVEWDFIEDAATRQGVLPLMYANREIQTRAPAAVLSRMGVAVRALVAQNFALTTELAGILEDFRAEGIPVLTFKGPVLSVAVYGRIGVRTSSDLDILVPEEFVSRALDLLSQSGYRSEFDLAKFGLKEYVRAEHAIPMHHSARGVNLDLHWRLTERHFLQTTATRDLFDRSIPITVMGHSMASFCFEDLLLYLCVHGAKDDWRKLEWICCLVELVRTQPSLNWSFVLKNAAQTRTTRALNLGILLSIALFRLTVPAAIDTAAQSDLPAVSLADGLVSRLMQPDLRGSWLPWRVRKYIFAFRVSSSWRDRFRIFFCTVFRIPHPEARELLLLPRSLRSAYYILRPLRLFWSLLIRLTESLRSKADKSEKQS